MAVFQGRWPLKSPKVMLVSLIKGGDVGVYSASKTAFDFEAEVRLAILNEICRKKASVRTIDAFKVSRESRSGRRTYNVLASVFFKLSGVLPYDKGEQLLVQSMRKAFVDRDEELVERNRKAVDAALANVIKIGATFGNWIMDEKVERLSGYSQRYRRDRAYGPTQRLSTYKIDLASRIASEAASSDEELPEVGLTKLVWHPDQSLRCLVSVGKSGRVDLWNAMTGEHLTELEGHQMDVMKPFGNIFLEDKLYLRLTYTCEPSCTHLSRFSDYMNNSSASERLYTR